MPVVNSIGAGDTFLGTFVSALAQGKSFKNSLVIADAAGRIVCGKTASYLEKADRRDLERITAESLGLQPTSTLKASEITHG